MIGILMLLGALLAQAQAQPAPPTVGSTYKNIQVFTDLKDGPTTQLVEAMQFMSGSLGVSCNYCHVSQQGPFDSDANARKLKARDMIRMVRALNANTFDGHQAVTCYTCHRGSSRPAGTPVPWDKTAEQIDAYRAAVSAKPGASSAPAADSTLPTVEELFNRYRQAVGASALKSIRLTGVNTVAMSGNSTPFEADALFPGKFLIVAKIAGGELQNIFNGSQGWRRSGGSTTALPPAQTGAIRVNVELLIEPVKFETSSAPRTVIGIEQSGGKRYNVVQSQLPGGPQRLYFDAESGLLYKVHTEVKTALGNRVEERTFEDYRTIQGFTLPFLIRNHYMEDQSEFRISTVEINVPLDPGLFEAGGGS
jgi:hypothetical protein